MFAILCKEGEEPIFIFAGGRYWDIVLNIRLNLVFGYIKKDITLEEAIQKVKEDHEGFEVLGHV